VTWAPPFVTYAGYPPYAGFGYGFPYDSGTVFAAEMTVGGYRPVDVPAAVTPAIPTDRAVLTVRVPTEATVWIQDAQSKQTGAERTFVSPPLEAGREYAYTVKAQWKAGDKEIAQTQTVNVRAGNRGALVFLPVASTAKLPEGR
jgi:uncharacterized protein (TIGR03000 family)